MPFEPASIRRKRRRRLRVHGHAKWLSEVGLANVRLHAGPHYSLEVGQSEGRTDKNGQFVLAVDHSQNNPDACTNKSQLAEEAGDTTEAERLYR